jgi:hypothetical protein
MLVELGDREFETVLAKGTAPAGQGLVDAID